MDRFLAGRHGVGEDGIHVTVVGTVLESRPVNAGLARGVTGHHRVFVVRDDQGLYLFVRTINIQLLAMGFGTGVVHEIRILLGASHPGTSCRGLFGERVVTRTTVHAIGRRHRVSQMLLVRESGTATGHSVSIHGPLAKLRTHHAIGRRNGITDFILKRLRGVGRGRRSSRGGLLLGTLQMRVGVRQVSRTRGVTPTDRALLEMTLQDITAREGVLAENTHVGTVTSVYSMATKKNWRVRISVLNQVYELDRVRHPKEKRGRGIVVFGWSQNLRRSR